MKIGFNIFLILTPMFAFVPPFRTFLFYLLVGRQLMKEQCKCQNSNRQPQREANIRVDVDPNRADLRFIKGSEYVDYEEVKSCK